MCVFNEVAIAISSTKLISQKNILFLNKYLIMDSYFSVLKNTLTV